MLGFYREIQIASLYGVSIEADMFYIGTLLPEFIIAVLGTASANIFMRQYHISQEKKDFAWTVFVLLGGVLILICAILFVAFPFIARFIAPGFTDGDLSVLTQMGRIMLGSLVSSVFFGVITASLNMNGRFYMAGLHGLLYNFILIASTFIFVPHLGIYGLAWSYLGANVIRIVLLLPFSWKFFGRFDFGLTLAYWRELPKGTTTYVLTGLQQIFERSFATSIQAGAVAALSYAGRIANLPILLFINSVLTVTYPMMIKQAEEERRERLSETVVLTLKIVLVSLICIELYLLLFRGTLFSLLFQYGKFGEKDSRTLSELLVLFAPVVLLAGINQVLLKTAHAIGKNMLTAVALIAAITVYVLAAKLLHMLGIDSLVWALLIYNAVMTAVLWGGITGSRRGSLPIPIRFGRFAPVCLAGGITWGGLSLLPESGFIGFLAYSVLYFLSFAVLMYGFDREVRGHVQRLLNRKAAMSEEKPSLSTNVAES